jgi:hypothetical protein
MYRIAIPKSRKNIISIMDNLVFNKQIELPDVKTNRVLGHYIKPWRDKGFISLYNEEVQRKTLCCLNIQGVERKDGSSGEHWHHVMYVFDDSILESSVRVKFPRL